MAAAGPGAGPSPRGRGATPGPGEAAPCSRAARLHESPGAGGRTDREGRGLPAGQSHPECNGSLIGVGPKLEGT